VHQVGYLQELERDARSKGHVSQYILNLQAVETHETGEKKNQYRMNRRKN
jgi:hypothetical protein